MEKIHIHLKTFIRDYIRWNNVSLIDDDFFQVTIKIERLNWIKRSIESYFEGAIEVLFDKEELIALSNEANENFIWTRDNRHLICNKEYFNDIKDEEVPECMIEDYKMLINQ